MENNGIYFNIVDDNLKAVNVYFGGKIATTSAKFDNIDNVGVLLLTEYDEIHKPGEETAVNKFDDKFNIKLIFDSIKSVEVVEQQLQRVKTFILNEQSREKKTK